MMSDDDELDGKVDEKPSTPTKSSATAWYWRPH
jgi:hypothetical protein